MALKDKIKECLQNLERKDIITKVETATDWVSDVVIVEKGNKVRICLNPSDLNKVIKKESFSIPTTEELTQNLSGKKVYTVLDMKDGFYQIPLTQNASYLCTFNTPLGRYRFKRMPFGLMTAPEIFQRENVRIFGDIKGVQIYFDDLIIGAETNEEHDRILRKVIERARQYNIKFNPSKVQFKLKQVWK